MLDKVTYPMNVSQARLALTDVAPAVAGPSKPRVTKAGYGWFTVNDDENPVSLLYKLDNLYIEGFRTRDNKVICTKGAGGAINADLKLNYTNEYGDLGYNRQVAIKVTLDNVNGALAALYNAKTTTAQDSLKQPLVYTAIAFAEAVRFDDVLGHILKGEAIDDLDWDKHKDKSKIRVVQH
ncbi:MAG: ribosome-inactivating family protein [Alphaproteobacteria bacterium]